MTTAPDEPTPGSEAQSGEERSGIDERLHRRLATELFQLVWVLLDKGHRTMDDDEVMLHAAHAARYHWGQTGQRVQIIRSEWQLSRVYCTLGRWEPAINHALRCIELCTEHGIGDADLAYAYEAMARATAQAESLYDSGDFVRLAEYVGNQILNPQDRRLFFASLATVPGYKEAVS